MSTDFLEGGSLPKKAAESKTERVPLTIAERWCGPEIIRAAGTSDGDDRTYQSWRVGEPARGVPPGIPWKVLGPLLKPRLVALFDGGTEFAQATSPAPLAREEVALMSDATGHEAFRKLATIFKNRHRDPDSWDAITRNLKVFARASDAGPTRPRARRSKVLSDAKTRRRE